MLLSVLVEPIGTGAITFAADDRFKQRGFAFCNFLRQFRYPFFLFRCKYLFIFKYIQLLLTIFDCTGVFAVLFVYFIKKLFNKFGVVDQSLVETSVEAVAAE
jgi:hypothetical protein